MTGNFLCDGSEKADRLLILAHGAGAPMDSDFMNIISERVAGSDLRVIRFEFPYMQKRRATGSKSPPNRMPILLDCWREVISRWRTHGRIWIGGKSMGGRAASMIADEQQTAGLICLGYPFHPPGKPEQTRTEHLAEMKTPTLIIQGERDPFGKPRETAGYDLAPTIRFHWLSDGDHSFKPRKSSGFNHEHHLNEAAAAISRFVLGGQS